MRKDLTSHQGKVIGFISSDGDLCKKVKRSKHMLRTPEGYGLDSHFFKEDFKLVKILDVENDIMYISKKEDWLEHGLTINRGFGEQIVLPLHLHEMRHRKQPQLVQ